MSVSEIVTGSLAGVGTAAVMYAAGLVRRAAREIVAEVRSIRAAPEEVIRLRTVVATNTEAIVNLSSALDRLSKLAEQAGGG